MSLEMIHGTLMTRKVPAIMLRRLSTMQFEGKEVDDKVGTLERALLRVPTLESIRATKIAPSGAPSMNKGV